MNSSAYIICLSIFLIIIMLTLLKFYYKHFTSINEIDIMKRPFLNIYDEQDRKLNVVFITHPFTRPETINEYENAIKNGIHFIGMSSYCEFPGIISNPYDILHDPNNDAWKWNYFKMVKGWCHCFKQPSKFIPNSSKLPLVLISESDFGNHAQHQPSSIPLKDREYDFIYVCLKDNDKCEEGWQSYNRNWEKAKKYIDIMCEKYKMKGLLIGRINCEIPKSCHNQLELTDFQQYSEYIGNYSKCKFIFIPNFCDASPRVMTEAMCFGLPILVNSEIIGGWKYVSPQTGEEFNDTNFESILGTFIKNLENYKPRDWYISNYGIENAGPRLLDFVRNCIPKHELNLNIDNIKWLKPGI